MLVCPFSKQKALTEYFCIKARSLTKFYESLCVSLKFLNPPPSPQAGAPEGTDRVAEAEARGREVLAAEGRQQPVVAAAPKNRAELAAPVEPSIFKYFILLKIKIYIKMVKNRGSLVYQQQSLDCAKIEVEVC